MSAYDLSPEQFREQIKKELGVTETVNINGIEMWVTPNCPPATIWVLDEARVYSKFKNDDQAKAQRAVVGGELIETLQVQP